jgi:uncharacterized membrane protein YbaN (DUF454 family)
MTQNKPAHPRSGLESSPRPKSARRVLLQGIGWLCVSLGLIGIPIPLLPTTPFLLLAGVCFLRSSPELHARLLADERLGPYLRQWNRDRSIPRRARRRAYALVAISFGISMALVDSLQLRLALGVFGACLVLFLRRLRSKENEVLSAAPCPVTRTGPPPLSGLLPLSGPPPFSGK